jgi:hypothetical protein
MTDQPTGPIVYGDDIGYYQGGYTSLAHSIPVAETIHGVGEPVFPRLCQYLADIGCDDLIPLVRAREEFGTRKHGQPLLTGDGRNTAVEIINEALDNLAYGMKLLMTNKRHANMIEESLGATAATALMWLDVIRVMGQEPITQEELDRAGEKAKEYRDLLGVKLLLPDCIVTKINKDETKC